MIVNGCFVGVGKRGRGEGGRGSLTSKKSELQKYKGNENNG